MLFPGSTVLSEAHGQRVDFLVAPMDRSLLGGYWSHRLGQDRIGSTSIYQEANWLAPYV